MKRLVLLSPDVSLEQRLDHVLKDHELYLQLEKFMDGELSSEILSFLKSVDRFRADESGCSTAKYICSEFIALNAPKEVNLSSATRNEVLKYFSIAHQDGLESRNVFDKAYEEVKPSLVRDGFARFLRKLEFEAQDKRLSDGGSKRILFVRLSRRPQSTVAAGFNNN